MRDYSCNLHCFQAQVVNFVGSRNRNPATYKPYHLRLKTMQVARVVPVVRLLTLDMNSVNIMVSCDGGQQCIF